jgi:peptidase E
MLSSGPPIYLFADSQPLFWKDNGVPFLQSVGRRLAPSPRLAYIGAANGDNPEYYELFKGAMESIGPGDCRRIVASFPAGDRVFVEGADLILLAGGDVERGWRVIESVGLRELLVQKYRAGAVLMGISAGAVHLGLFGHEPEDSQERRFFQTLQLVPFIIGAHEERTDWARLKESVRLAPGSAAGIGIPAGGGMIYHSNGIIEPLRHPVYQFAMKGGDIACERLPSKGNPAGC